MGQPHANGNFSATVLFVDDEEHILSAIRRNFRSSGYRIILANSAAAGLEALERDHVDVVVSDMRMPGMDGAQFLEQVAIRWPHTVRVVMTGYADLASTTHAITKGRIFRTIDKPWASADVQRVIAEALATQRHSPNAVPDHGSTP
jgi:DNA-binding NtrC family response regulator